MFGLRIVLAVVAGVLLYDVAVVYFGGVLAAFTIPKSYFAVFGRERAELGLAFVGLGSWALPVLGAVFLGAFVVLRALRNVRACAFALTFGMLSCALYWHARFAALVARQSHALSFGEAFTSTLWPVWWTVPNVLAPWAGLALAVWFVVKRSRRDTTGEV